MININIYEPSGNKAAAGASMTMGAPAPTDEMNSGGGQGVSYAGLSSQASSESGPPPTLFDGGSTGESSAPAMAPDEMVESSAGSAAPAPSLMADASPGMSAPEPVMQAGEAGAPQSDAPEPSMGPEEESKGSKSAGKEDATKKK